MKTTTDIEIRGTTGLGGTISAADLTAARTASLPDKSGTLAMVSDLVANAAPPLDRLCANVQFGGM